MEESMLKKLEEMKEVAVEKINAAANQLELNECRAELGCVVC